MPSRDRWRSKFQIKEGTWVFVPTDETIAKGYRIKKRIENVWDSPDIFYHLKKGGHVKALQHHLGNKYFLRLDIKDFFGHINRSRITRSLKNHLSYTEAREIAMESSVRLPGSSDSKYILPFGFVQSPIIASLCFSKSAFFGKLSSLCKDGFALSVYVDDIILSHNDCDKLNKQMSSLKDASERSGFPLNDKKQEGPGECITAFNVFLKQGEMRIIPEKLDEFRNVYQNSENECQRAGIESYVNSINSSQAEFLYSPTTGRVSQERF